MAVEQAESNDDCLSPIYRRPADDPAPSPHKKKEVYRDGDLASQRKYYSAHLETSVFNDDIQSCVLQFVCGYMHLSEVQHKEWNLGDGQWWLMTDGFFNVDARRYRIGILDENLSKNTIERIKREIKLKEEGVELYSVWEQDFDDNCESEWTGASLKGQIKFLNLEEPKFLYFVLDYEEHINRRYNREYDRVAKKDRNKVTKWFETFRHYIDIRLSTSIDVIEKQRMIYKSGKYDNYDDDESSGDESY